MKYTDIVFDFDGTLSDTYPCFTRALLDTLDYYGLSDTYESAYAKLKVSVGHALKSYVFPVPYETVNHVFHAFHVKRAPLEQKPYEGAEDILRFVKESGGRNYVFTHSGKIVTNLLELWGFMKYIDGMLDSTEHVRRKPDPEGLLRLMDRYSVDPRFALMVGDRDIDTDCGKNGGIASCLFDPEGYYPETRADYKVNLLTDIKDIVR